MKNIIILTLLLLVNTIAFAQEHNMGANFNCKLKKGNFFNIEKHPCPACEKNDKKEKEAKNAEVKRRNDKIIADAKAKKDADDKAYKDKIAADKLKEGSGNVLINAQPTSTIVKSKPEKSKVEKAIYKKDFFYNVVRNNSGSYRTLDYIYFTKNSTGFKINGKSILDSNEFAGYFAIDSISNGENFPPNIGIVRLHQTRTIPPGDGRKVSIEVPIFDLVDSNGVRLFNDDKITLIMHFVDDYFIIGRGNYYHIWYDVGYGTFSDRVEIYNVTTKKSFVLDKQTKTYGTTKIDKIVNMGLLDGMWLKGSYKAYIKSEIELKHRKIYYIDNAGQIETQDIYFKY